MLETAIAQLRFAASIALGRPFPLWALARLIAAVQDTRREFGVIGSGGADLLGGPALDEETRRAVHLRRRAAPASGALSHSGSGDRPDMAAGESGWLSVSITVLAAPRALAVRIADQGGSRPIPKQPAAPDLDARLAGRQTPRGWGLFLIKNLVDEMHIGGDATQHTLELILYLEGSARIVYVDGLTAFVEPVASIPEVAPAPGRPATTHMAHKES